MIEKTNIHKGWFEPRQPIVTQHGIQDKAPIHHKVAVKKGLEAILRVSTVRENERRTCGYWTHENIMKELKEVIAELGHFPIRTELKEKDRNDLIGAMNKNGGMNKFRTLLDSELHQKPANYWTNENTVKELKEVIAELGHFPIRTELKGTDRNNLVNAIAKNGGWNKLRTVMGYELIKKSKGYWTQENILKELKKTIAELGHFPTFAELKKIDKNDLIGAITANGGMGVFRTALGCELLRKPYGYWTQENILRELKKTIAELGHFPTRTELKEKDRNDLSSTISKYGGIDTFRKKLGYPPSLEEQLDIGTYVKRRGYKSEKEVKKILVQYCKLNGHPEPIYNKKLSIGNVIEFVCGGRVGIDVTNTKLRDGCVIRRKYLEKDYHKYLNKLWIVVLSDVFSTEDYIRFNEESPNNVEVMSVWDLIDTLQVDIDEHSRRKLSALETCTLRTKDDLINSLKNRNLIEYT